MARVIRNIGLFVLIPIILFVVLYAWLIYSSPLNIKEMDLNKNGWVSFTEAEYTASYGVREVEVDGKKCTEYFAYKDGLPLKVECNEKK